MTLAPSTLMLLSSRYQLARLVCKGCVGISTHQRLVELSIEPRVVVVSLERLAVRLPATCEYSYMTSHGQEA